MNSLTIFVILIFIILIIAGCVRGLLKSVLRTVLTIMSIGAAYILAPITCNFIYENTGVDEYFDNIIYKIVEESVSQSINGEIGNMVDDFLGDNNGAAHGAIDGFLNNTGEAVADIAMNIEPTKEQQEKIIENLDIPDFAKKLLKENNNSQTKKDLGVKNFYQFISAFITKMIVNALSFMCVFILIYSAAMILTVVAGIVSHLPIINSFNRIGGAVFGGFEALLLVWVLFLIVAIIINSDLGKGIYAQIEESAFLQGLYDTNIFLPLITKM